MDALEIAVYGGVLLVAVIAGLVFWLPSTRKKENRHKYGLHEGEYEIPFKKLTLSLPLGAGSFGIVWKGFICGRIPVAIKAIRANMSKEELLAEGRVMKDLKHENIVKCLGTSVNPRGEILLVMELVPNGSLLKFLHDEGNRLNVKDLLKIALYSASGMEYLESKNVVHRDLAARNVLMGDDLVAKISDFGLARILEGSIYNANPQGPICTFIWTAPEAIEFKKFSIKSDVWSFGILLYEIFSRGANPLPGFINKDVLPWLKQGNRWSCPENCPKEVYSIMKDCWKANRNERPRFADVANQLTEFYI